MSVNIHFLPLRLGEYPAGVWGWIVPSIEGGGMPKGQRGSLHATRCTEGGSDCREDGDYYVEDLTPESVVVESSHSEIIG